MIKEPYSSMLIQLLLPDCIEAISKIWYVMMILVWTITSNSEIATAQFVKNDKAIGWSWINHVDWDQVDFRQIAIAVHRFLRSNR